MAELNRLLSFMSSWDRQAVLDKYGAMLEESADPESLIEELGTPTKLAIDLARTYVPTPPPAKAAETEDDAVSPAEPGPAEEAPEQIQWDLGPKPAAETPTKRVLNGGALAGYLVPAILIGLPVAVALVCLGLPFIAAGAVLILGAVKEALKMIALLSLFSDILLTVGGALCVCAVGVLLVWLGIWLSMELCWLWADKVLVGLGRKLCMKEVPAE